MCTPYSNAYVWKTIQDPESGEWVLLLTASIRETMGLMYQHLLPENPAEPFFETQILGNTIGTCYNPSGSGAVRHVHIANFATADWPAQGLPPQAGYSDVLADFSIPVHYASFAPVLQASIPLSGIGFWPEGIPLALDIIRGSVDFRIAARSANSESSSVDSTGVRKLRIESISRENPITGEYIPSGYYSSRTVFDWSGELEPNEEPGVPLNEYRCLYQYFMGGTVFDYSYICTNTSNLDPGPKGIDNIWTAEYDPILDYNEGEMCRGAWDTRHGSAVGSSTPWHSLENSGSSFPDGRYLINVTATSHTGNTESISLPVDDVTSPNYVPEGIIVDNFIPYVDQVIFYTTYPDGEYHLLYHGDWTSVSETERTLTSKPAGYLPYGMGILPQGYLGMAVRFSEPMDPDELPAVWVEGKWADEAQWSSQNNKSHWFYPASIDPVIPSGVLNPSPDSDNTGHWVFYESRGYSDPGYVGALTINVGVQTSVPGTGRGLDLAGNQLDPDPSTIESPLALYSRTIHSLVYSDCSYSWGEPPVYSKTNQMLIRGNSGLREFCVRS